MFIEVVDTPNPLTLKFIPGKNVMKDGTLDIINADNAKNIPIAKMLFDILGVTRVFLGSDFLSVSKSPDEKWEVVKPQVLGVILNYFTQNDEINLEHHCPAQKIDNNNEIDSIVVKEIKNIIEQRIRPAVAQDGGDIVFVNFENGIVFLRLQGACAGCPSATITLKNGIENMLKHYIPEVLEVQAVN